MRRSYGYYWAKLIGAVLILTAWVVGFILIGDSWWQLANAGCPRGCDDPDRVPRP